MASDAPPTRDRSAAANRGLYAVFFASGVTALLYETAWVRILSVELGSTVDAVTTVLAVFMAGLALGGYWFGEWIDGGRPALRIYAALELAIAAYAVGFVLLRPYFHPLIALVMPEQATAGATWAITTLFAAATMLPPTILMGGTLPVLAKHVARDASRLGANLGSLYGWNTLGAVVGCLAQAFVLTAMIGVDRSILLAAAINAVLGSGVLWYSRRVPSRRSEQAQTPTSNFEDEGPSLPPMLLVIAFTSGCVTLAAEVLWTRLFINLLSGNVLVFATILAAFLAGLGLGSLAISRWLDRWERLDIAAGLSLLISSAWLLLSSLGQSVLAEIFAVVQRVEAVDWPGWTPYLSLAAMFLLILPAAVTMGLTLPILFRWGNPSGDHLGAGLGRLYAVNTIGSIAGSMLGGFVLLRWLGVTASLLLLGGLLAGVTLLASRAIVLRMASAGVAIVSVALSLAPGIRQPTFWFNGGFGEVQRIPADETSFLREGVEATVGVFERHGVRTLTVNGLIVADSSREDLWDLLLKAHLPMMLHPDPRRVALVGLGAGVSLGAVESYDIDHVDCIEISPEVVAAHRLFAHVNGRCWEDPRARIRIDDGRRFLAMTDQRYDVISVDPVDPPVCNFYTQDFFQLCHDRLADGGMMVEWVPLFRLSQQHLRVIMQAFANVFDEASVWYDGTSILLIGSRNRALQVDLATFLRRNAEPRVLENLGSINNPGPWLLLATYVTGPEGLRRLIGGDVTPNTDDRPFLEYDVLRAGQLGDRDFADNLEMLAPAFESIVPRLRPADRTPEDVKHLAQAESLMQALLRVRIKQLRGQSPDAERLRARVIKEFRLREADLQLLEPFWPED